MKNTEQKPIGFILHNPGIMGKFRNLKKNTFATYITGEFINYPEHWTPVYAYAQGQMQGSYIATIHPKKVYISGQITGLSFGQAKAKFDKAENDAVKRLGQGIEIINPMKLEHKPDPTWEDYMEKDIAELLKCDFIYIWWTSDLIMIISILQARLKILYLFDKSGGEGKWRMLCFKSLSCGWELKYIRFYKTKYGFVACNREGKFKDKIFWTSQIDENHLGNHK